MPLYGLSRILYNKYYSSTNSVCVFFFSISVFFFSGFYFFPARGGATVATRSPLQKFSGPSHDLIKSRTFIVLTCVFFFRFFLFSVFWIFVFLFLQHFSLLFLLNLHFFALRLLLLKRHHKLQLISAAA